MILRFFILLADAPPSLSLVVLPDVRSVSEALIVRVRPFGNLTEIKLQSSSPGFPPLVACLTELTWPVTMLPVGMTTTPFVEYVDIYRGMTKEWVLTDDPRPVDGMITLDDKPGFGYELSPGAGPVATIW